VASLVAQGEDLTRLPGIGKAISRKIEDIVNSGTLPQLEKSLSKLQPEIAELANRPALDPKQVLRVYKKLKIGSLKELQQRLESGEIREALGARVDFHIRRGLHDRPGMLLYYAENLCRKIETVLSAMPGITHICRTGSLRRKKDTVGDLNFLISSKSAAESFQHFSRFGGVQSTEKRSSTERVFKLSSGVAVTLAWTSAKNWGLSLLVHTGSRGHLQELETLAARKRIELSTTGLKAKKIGASEEEEIYRGLGLPFIEPELREGRGEVATALAGKLTALIHREDLKGDLHMHTTASDGANTLAQMAEAARSKGYEYIAITDHSQSLKITNGLTEKRLLQHIKAIDKLNAKLSGFRVLKSAEVDILEDGKLDYSTAVLKELDLTICSIHSRFGLNKQQQTERILRAMDHRCFNILGHATGRLLLKREGYELDMERIIVHAHENGCFFEINSSPDRLDLSDENAKLAKDQGVKIAVNTDAHSISELDFIAAGINQARRAWLGPKDVLNTLPLKSLLSLMRR
jgi:DNA polymerase (family 10)